MHSRRTVIVNRGRPNEPIFSYTDNAVYTTKYSVFSFLPKFLYEQLSRYANLFFLFIGLIQQIPGITPVSRWGTLVPLSIINTLTAVKEIREDWKRKKADDEANNASCEIFNKGKNIFERRKWRDVKVGDIIRVVNEHEFPADLVLLSSSGEDNVCFVETSNIDGETSLKRKQSANLLVQETDLRSFDGLIRCDEPNNQIHDFEGVFIFGNQEIPLAANNFLLRGSRLQNTARIIGVVIYTGRDTKLVKNTRETRIKRSTIETLTNTQIAHLFYVLLFLVICLVVSFFLLTYFYSSKFAYLQAGSELEFWGIVKKFLTFLVLLNNLVPISLILTMEVIRIRLGTLIENDIELYCPETDTPTQAKTSSLIEELGQVQYIFSDKTGTLTRNEMVLRKLCIKGKVLNLDDDEVFVEEQEFPGIQQMLLIMAACNTCVIGSSTSGEPVFQSSSPDEVAIVNGAALLGGTLAERRSSSLKVKFCMDDQSSTSSLRQFKILASLEFDSARKRMSLVVQDADDGKYWIFTKGADTVMLPRLAQGQDAVMMQTTTTVTDGMAVEGLRTLMYGYREISSKEFEEWMQVWKSSLLSMRNKKQAIEEANAMVERDLTLAGISGLEDRLQYAVPETISKLHQAHLRLWILTGDKLETAVNIGYSCQLLNPQTKILCLSNVEGLLSGLETFCTKEMDGFEMMEAGPGNVAIVIEAAALQVIFDDATGKLQELFLEKARNCRTVICCRVSPSQKAEVVQLVQVREGAVCLAIGDGANDVGMIQAAQIGVGISGKEGLQAARSADFSIAQFCFLQRLLLVHGTWAYHRISRAAIFCVYKNILLYACQLWFAGLTLFSGQTIFESWMIGLYNVVFTAWPPVIIGLTDQFVTAPFLLANPSLYQLGQENTFYNGKTFWQSAMNGFWQSLLALFLTTMLTMHGIILPDGRDGTLFFMGSILYAGVMLTVMLKCALLINYWTLFAVLGLLSCPVTWVIYVISYDWISSAMGSPHAFSDLVGLSKPLLTAPIFYAIVILIPIACLLRDFVWKFYQRQFSPQEYHIVQELQKEERRQARRLRKLGITTDGDDKSHSKYSISRSKTLL